MRKKNGISTPQSYFKAKQVCTNVQGELSVTKNCQWCSCFRTEILMLKKCQSQKQVQIFHGFKRNKSKQITSLKSDSGYEPSRKVMFCCPTIFERRRYGKGNPTKLVLFLCLVFASFFFFFKHNYLVKWYVFQT